MNPTDKLRVVKLLQARDETVAVTSDGVNDAPSARRRRRRHRDGAARLGDLARQAADLVLTDEAYPRVAAAVAKGRNIGSQLRPTWQPTPTGIAAVDAGSAVGCGESSKRRPENVTSVKPGSSEDVTPLKKSEVTGQVPEIG